MLEININGQKGIVIKDNSETLVYNENIAKDIDEKAGDSKPNYTLIKDKDEKVD